MRSPFKIYKDHKHMAWVRSHRSPNYGLKIADTNRERYGIDVYSKRGRIGGAAKGPNTHLKGFGSHPKLASEMGKIGGKISRRSHVNQE